MSTRYPTNNPLDRIFLGVANMVIVIAGAVVLYHCIVTSLDPPPYETSASDRVRSVAMFTSDVANPPRMLRSVQPESPLCLSIS